MLPLREVPFDSRVNRGAPAGSTTELQLRHLLSSPLRAGLLRHLHATPDRRFEIESLMQTFGRVRQDIENCLHQLVAGGLVTGDGTPARYGAERALSPLAAHTIARFLADQPGVTTEEQSVAVQRFRGMIGHDEKMIIVFESIRTVVKTDLPVLILGPTGSGKEVVARMIHELSRRAPHRFQAINCAALPDSLFESELFGYEKGAFTGANGRKTGRVEQAHHGTLFLDEIGDLSAIAQAKLLRMVEDRRIERLGGNEPVDVDFRLLSATNRPLDVLVAQREFREDLYYRINAFSIRLPALRERPGDIPLLAHRFLVSYCAAQGLPVDAKVFSPEALALLQSYPWPGNIRELLATIPRAALSSRDRVVRAEDIEFLHRQVAPVRPATATQSLREVERAHIQHVLESAGWNKKKSARLLQIGRETLYRKIAEYHLAPSVGAGEFATVGTNDAAAGSGATRVGRS